QRLSQPAHVALDDHRDSLVADRPAHRHCSRHLDGAHRHVDGLDQAALSRRRRGWSGARGNHVVAGHSHHTRVITEPDAAALQLRYHSHDRSYRHTEGTDMAPAIAPARLSDVTPGGSAT